MGADIKSMTLEQARTYRDSLYDQGKTESTSKEVAKVADYIKVLKNESGNYNFGADELKSAYTNLSRGVTETGGWTEEHLDDIEKYTGSRPQLTDPNQVPGYLDGFQSSVYGSANTPELRDQLTKQLEPEGGMPDAINRVETYENMREQYGVADLETQATDLKTQLESEYSIKRNRVNAAEGGQVAMGVIAGRVGEIERQQNERIDVINRSLNTITDQLNTSYNVIQQYMNYMGLDYQDAMTRYNSEFDRNIQMYNMVESKLDKQQQNARANLQLYMNAITSGNMNYSNLSSSQRSTINKLEVQSGLPIGFTSSLKLSAKDQLIKINDDGTEAYFMDANGNITTKSTGATAPVGGGVGGTGATATAFRNALTQGRTDLESGRNWGEVWDRIHNAFPSATSQQIDAGLGGSGGAAGSTDDSGWAKPGAYEDWVQKTGTKTTTERSTDALSAMSDAVSAYQKATTSEQKTAIRNAFVADFPDYAQKFADAI